MLLHGVVSDKNNTAWGARHDRESAPLRALPHGISCIKRENKSQGIPKEGAPGRAGNTGDGSATGLSGRCIRCGIHTRRKIHTFAHVRGASGCVAASIDKSGIAADASILLIRIQS